ncbi:hypothetical protein ACUQHA_003455 [Acinetobacter baumannii]
MNTNCYNDLLSQRATVREQLSRLPSNAWMTKLSLEARLSGIQETINELEATTLVEPAKVVVTFSGNPVDGSSGIWADFASKAMQSFTDAVSALAAGLNTAVQAMGKIPNKDNNRLYITSTALGSFGFVLEEKMPQQTELGLEQDSETDVKKALDQITSVFQSAMTSDEVLSETLNEINDRALEKVRAFIKILNDSDALCSIKLDDKKITFRDKDDLTQSLDRLKPDNILVNHQEIDGTFIGYLPIDRIGEFQKKESHEIIKIKVSKDLADSDVINQHLNALSKISLTVTTVGKSKPKYTLEKIPDWTTQITS